MKKWIGKKVQTPVKYTIAGIYRQVRERLSPVRSWHGSATPELECLK